MNQTEDRPRAEPSSSGPPVDDALVVRAVREYLGLMEAGDKPDRSDFAARYPEIAEALVECLGGLDFVQAAVPGLSRPGADPEAALADGDVAPQGGTLGDFRIVREVGRGGMGVVYEAEQLSLRRRVALKVLPFAVTMDPRHLQRFHNEAHAAACLHHTNIVPVFSVGCERSVHFYAMQFIQGQPLSEIVRQLCRMEKKAPSTGEEHTVAYQPSPGDTASTPPAAAITPLTGEGRRSRDYYRKVAELGIQAAEALEHAHQLGIVHRDIKPANLLLDGRGNLWVTDFGLAHIQHGEASLTGTGQMVGTPRYMSPEQALAKRVPIDHRTDVYSLGVTLYELLALQPAFTSEDRHELLRQIAFEEPAKPRRLERTIPTELEIIVLKAMEKQPQDRYATAQELAGDLRRWLLDQPIRARRPSWGHVARKWARRHQSAVASAGLVFLVSLAILAGGAGWVVHDRAARRSEAERKANTALQAMADLLEEDRLPEAPNILLGAESILAGVSADSALQLHLDELRRDLRMAQRLEEARITPAARVKEGRFDSEAADKAYSAAFQEYGLDAEGLDPRRAAAQILARPIARQLVAALDDWIFRRQRRGKEWLRLMETVRAADPDEWRNQLREALGRNDRRTLEALAASARVEELSPATLVFLGRGLRKVGAVESAVVILERAWQKHPTDFWINHQLAQALHDCPKPRVEESIRYYTAAVALRPRSPGAHLNRSRALYEKGDLDAAIAEVREALALDSDYAEAHSDLGAVFWKQGRLDEAVNAFREAIRLRKDFPTAHCNLGVVLAEKGLLDEAIEEFQESIRLWQDFPEAHTYLGKALRKKGLIDEAITEHREAIRLKPDLAVARFNLGSDLSEKGRLDEAAVELQESVRLQKDDPANHYGLGTVRLHQGRFEEAAAELREAIRLRKDYPEAHCNLGLVLVRMGRFPEAVDELRLGHRLGSRKPGWAYPSVQWLQGCEKLVELDSKRTAILRGQKQPTDAAERIDLAQLCRLPCKKLYAATHRFYQEAFADKPQLADDLNAQHRYNAACAAALAGCGQGKDADKLDPKERARLRQQALDWLRADLKAHRQLLEKSAGKAGSAIAQRMQQWLQDEDFAGVRGDKALAKLPEEERKEWQKLWQEVEILQQRATQAPKTAPSARP